MKKEQNKTEVKLYYTAEISLFRGTQYIMNISDTAFDLDMTRLKKLHSHKLLQNVDTLRLNHLKYRFLHHDVII